MVDQTIYQGLTGVLGVPNNFAGEIMIYTIGGFFLAAICIFIAVALYKVVFR